jgi:dolichol-phosphate mannosyltransferase
MDLSVVIATWNEAGNLAPLLGELRAALAPHGLTTEVIIVDGGSKDGTQEVARGLGCEVFEQRTPGFGGAVREGLARARGDYILTLDADLSHSPSFFDEMWRRREEADLVIASRYIPGGSADMPRSRALLSRVLNRFFAEVLAIPLRDLSSGFRLYRRTAVQAFETQARDFNVMQELLTGILVRGGRIVEVPFHYRPRVYGSSHARIWKFGRSYMRSLAHLLPLRFPLFTGGPARRIVPYALLIALVAAGVYVNSLGYGAVRWDDDYMVFENPAVARAAPADVARLFDPRAPREDFGSEYTPLSNLTFFADRWAFGLANHRLFHIQNVAYHALAAVLLFLLVNRVRQSAAVAFAAALIFGLHPAASEAVAWISGRRTALCATLMLGAALAFARWLADGRRLAYAASLVLALAADLVKQPAVALPLVLVVVDLARQGTRPAPGRRAAAYVPHALLALGFAALHVAVGRREGIVGSHALDVVARLEVTAIALARYVWLAFYPSGLRPHYSMIFKPGEAYAMIAGGALAAVALAAAIVFSRRRAPALFLGAGGAVAALAPALGAPGTQAIGERYLYLPLAFAAVAFAGGFARLARVGPPPSELPLERALVRRRLAAGAAFLVVLAVLGRATFVRNRVWRDDVSLWTDAAAKEPSDPVASGQLARALLQAKRFDDAERELRRAVDLNERFPIPGGPSPLPGLRADIALLCETRGDQAGAERALQDAVRGAPASAVAAVRLGDFYVRRGEIAKARAVYRYALESCADPTLARERLAELPTTP